MSESGFSLGDIVTDKEVEGGDEAVVVNTPNATASDWDVRPRDCTLAEDNPDYPEDDRVIAVVYRDLLEEKLPYYTGEKPLELGSTNFYAFPESRLSKVGNLRCHEIDLSEIEPSPYHTREFRENDNREFIDEVEERGWPGSYPLVRPTNGTFEIVNGHKRVWVSDIAGLDSVKCRVAYLDDWESVKWFCDRHLSDDLPETEKCTEDEVVEMINRIREDWPDRFDEIYEVRAWMDKLDYGERRDDLQSLASGLEDRGISTDVDSGKVVCEKLGQTFEVEVDGTVSGGGAIRDRVEDVVQEVIENSNLA